ncbi:hypothetical protein J3A83DRAFT_4099090 [Scleroderma citrinum]
MHHHQFPLTAAYAFTNYQSQGQTLPMVSVDITTPPTGGFSLFNLYVALSHSSSQSTIRLLCDFDNKVFCTAHCPELLAENDCIDAMDQATLVKWRAVGNDTRESYLLN